MKPKPLYQIKNEVQQAANTTRSYLYHRLRIQALKGVVIFLLYLYLWHTHSMIKWTLLLVIPVGLFYVLRVMLTKHRLEAKLSNMMDKIDQMER